jgi:hypothetical protein
VRTTLRWLGAIAAVLICAVAIGACGGEDDSSQSVATSDDEGDDGGGGDEGDDGGGDDEGDDGGGDDDGDGGGVPGAPIDIPSFQQDQGRPLDDVLADIEATVREQCDGELCIEIRVEMSDEGFDECQFVETVPPQGSSVERGGTLVVIAGTQPCDGEDTDGEDTDGEDTDGEDTDGEDTEDDTDDGTGDETNEDTGEAP